LINVDLTGQALLDREAETGIGLIVPFDLMIDREYWRWVPDSTTLYLTRTPSLEIPMNVEFASAVGDLGVISRATRDLAAAQPDVTVYACTSGSFVDGLSGEARIREAMQEAGARRAITTSGALLKAIHALGVRRLAVGTPYDATVTERLSRFLGEAGYETTSSAFLGLTGNIFRVSRQSVRALALAADSPDADAVFLSCTNLRTFDVLEEVEKELGKPVLSANQVTMWAALRAAGLAEAYHRPPSSPLWL
jgi:maleate isomerase